MDFLVHHIAQRVVHHAMASLKGLIGESEGYDDQLIVSTAAHCTLMTDVFSGIVEKFNGLRFED